MVYAVDVRDPLVFIAGVTDSENPSNPLDCAESVVRAVVNLLYDVLVWRDAAAASGDMLRERCSMHEAMAQRLLRGIADSPTIRAALALELARDWVKPRGMPERVQRAIAEAVGVEICRVRNVYISARPDGSTWVSALVSSPRECKACRARGSARGPARWEWAIINPRPGERVSGWETRQLASGLVVAVRPCPACSVDGQPTGVEQ